MKKIIAILACAGLLTHAQSAPIIDPISAALTIGKWMMFQDKKRLFYIEVESRASTFEEAKLEGFRLAIEQAVGTLVLSESVSQKQKLTRDEIITYAAGYVDRYEISSRTEQPGAVTLKMKVYVAHSTIANRLLNRSETEGTVDGDRVDTQLATITQQRQDGERVLSTVLADFPTRSFDISLEKTEVVYGPDRVGRLHIGAWVNWNKKYLESLSEAIEVTTHRPNCNDFSHQKHCLESFQVRISKPGFSFDTKSYFDDTRILDLFRHQVWGKNPAVLLTIHGTDGNPVYRECYRNLHAVWKFIDFSGGNVNVMAAQPKYVDTYINLSQLPVKQLDKIEMKIISQDGC